ncbi:MAG: OprO/OprP family phosphate-selective porin [Gemmataceae bacterium]|nr:OprO/OprP family phosphate-selective porin [Gemmataceae bacterium]
MTWPLGKWIGAIVAAVLGLWFGCNLVAADERDEEIDRLTKRLEAVERDLERLSEPAPADKTKKDDGASWQEVGKNLKMEASWRNGLWFENADKSFRWNVGGVIQCDWAFFGGKRDIINSIGQLNNLVDPGQSLQDGMVFRRARLRFGGLMWEQVEFFAQYEFAQATDLRRRALGIQPVPPTPPFTDFDPAEGVGFNEVYLGLTKLPWLGTVRIGRHRESLNFITATSDSNQVWLERGLMFDAFNGDFNFSNGITIQRNFLDERAYALLGFFHANNFTNRGFFGMGDGEYAYDVRCTYLPIYDEDAQAWLHLGIDYSYRNPHMYQLRYRARPMVRSGPNFLTPNLITTGMIFTPDAQQIINFEFATSWGPFCLVAEAAGSWVTNAYTGGLPRVDGTLPPGVTPRGTYRAWGGYLEVLYFLTPDHRKYLKERPGFARVVPTSNFFLVDGIQGLSFNRGAWEIGARYDYLDLTDAGINGGTGSAYTFCANWYLNPNARWQFNYSLMERRFSPSDTGARRDGWVQAFGVRFNIDF